MADTCSDGSPGSSALMLNTVVTLAKKSLVSPFCWMLSLIVFILAMLTEIPTILLVLLAGGVGILTIVLGKGSKQKREEES